MKKSEMQEVTYGSYSFLRKPVLRTVGENKVRIGWIVTPNVPKDADAYELLSGMIEEGTLTRVQLAKAAFGQVSFRRHVDERLLRTPTAWRRHWTARLANPKATGRPK